MSDLTPHKTNVLPRRAAFAANSKNQDYRQDVRTVPAVSANLVALLSIGASRV
jgi:hypothetical protein